MWIVEEYFGALRVAYPQRKPFGQDRTYHFSYSVNNRLSVVATASSPVYRAFRKGLPVRDVFRDQDWLLCVVEEYNMPLGRASDAYSVGKSRFGEEELELLFPPEDWVTNIVRKK